MALVHSRVRRVFYLEQHPFFGGLGSVWKIHTTTALNHHYEVFRCQFTEDASSYPPHSRF
jgi:tRNA-specific adenosine deaminase 3